MDEFYYELLITPTSSLAIFSDFLFEVTQSAIEEKDGSIIIRDTQPLDDILWACEQFSQKLGIAIQSKLEKKKNEDWISKYKNSINPIEVGSFYIRPDWIEKKDNLIDIIINPALAFGSGHHETTSSCLIAIDKYLQKSDTLLDVGCGSGILSIAAAKKGAVVDICDTDEVAVESAKENFMLNDVMINQAWVGSANGVKTTYNFVIANIIADVILIINKDLKTAVKPNGILILSGIIDKYFHKIEEKFSDFTTLEKIEKGEWHTLVLQRK
jgi:ribosomal protein L11 methyltransferase